jgi:hypothetical protein
MDLTTMMMLFLFLGRRRGEGREMEDMALPFLLLSMAQAPNAASAPPPTLPPPAGYPQPAPPSQNLASMLPLLMLLRGGDRWRREGPSEETGGFAAATRRTQAQPGTSS